MRDDLNVTGGLGGGGREGGAALTTQLLLQEDAGGRVLGSRGGLHLADLPLGSVLQVEVPEGAAHASPHLYIPQPRAHRTRGEPPARVTSVRPERAHA